MHITNSPAPKESPLIHPLANDLAAPLLTVFNTYATQTEVNDNRLQRYMRSARGDYDVINLYAHTNADLPMNWVISQHRLNEMDTLVNEAKTDELKKLIQKMNQQIKNEQLTTKN